MRTWPRRLVFALFFPFGILFVFSILLFFLPLERWPAGALTWIFWSLFVLALAISFYLLARTLHAIDLALSDIGAAIDRIQKGDLRQNVYLELDEELDGLGTKLNRMMASLRQRLDESYQEKTQLEAILANMVDGVIMVNARKRVLLVNRAGREIFGLENEEVLDRHHLELFHSAELDGKLDLVLSTGAPTVQELKIFYPDEKLLEAYLAPVKNEEGLVTGAILVVRDISQREKLDRIRRDFVANVSHELLTPLTSIKGFAETLLEGALEDAENARRFIGIIDQEAGRLIRLINDLLDLSRLEAEGVQIKKQAVELGPVVNRVISLLASAAAKAGVTLEADLPKDLPPVEANPDQIAQVLTNLLDNSLKYTPAGGKVGVTAEEKATQVMVTVWDTGIGIPRKDLARIFERFYRVDKDRSRATGGTGLGLAIVKHIVEAHGGRTWAESEVGKGTKIHFLLKKAHPRPAGWRGSGPE